MFQRVQHGPAVPELHTPRLLLRALTEDDTNDIFEYARDPEVAHHTIWEPHRTTADTRAFLSLVSEQHRAGSAWVWAICHKADSKVIGTCGLANYAEDHSRAELGFALSRKYWGHGYATESVHALLAFAFDRLVLNRVEAMCKIDNPASARVLEKAGMSLEGILRKRERIKGVFEDLKIYSILQQEYRIMPKF